MPGIVGYPGGSIQNIKYTPLLDIKELSTKDPASNLIANQTYEYNPSGTLKSKKNQAKIISYNYDELYQLISADTGGERVEEYAYDISGNRTQSLGIDNWTYNQNNELESYGNFTFQYDAEGNLTEKRENGELKQKYIYNSLNRLVRLESGNGKVIAEYIYDPFGRRIVKKLNNKTCVYLYSDEGLICEALSTGEIETCYGYRPDSAWGTDPLFMKRNSEYYWYINNRQGTPEKLISESGLTVWHGEYDSFGKIKEKINDVTNNLRLPGQYYDEESGLNYNWNRYYNPETGRYTSIDPAGEGINFYTYVANNPNLWTDPLGLCKAHTMLAAAGMIPGLGIVPDLLDSLWYLAEGDYKNSLFALGAAIPGWGYLARGGQFALKFAKKFMPQH